MTKRLKTDKFSKDIALDYLAKMETELFRSTKLVRSLLDFSRQSTPRFWEVDVNEIVNRSFDLGIHSSEMQSIKIIKDMDPALPKIMADFDQLQQVCTNLIMNAIQAMPDGGRLTLKTSVNGDYILIEIKDTGVGLKPGVGSGHIIWYCAAPPWPDRGTIERGERLQF
jgi:signal transduction histidine kinase